MSFKRSRATFEADNGTPPQHAPFAAYGTPLPAFDSEARDDGSYVPIWKQEVTDERGRKRLHGAFTGGFSAGYFNTVGSKEGWTPSTFVSSRSSRAKDQKDAKQQRAEDFMDEEDLAEQAESQKLETTGGFAGLGAGSGEGGDRGMFSDLFRSTGETMGMKLLQKMGWRQGQGIGPRIKRTAKGDDRGAIHSFAPDDTNIISFTKKTDKKGLGHDGEEKLGSGDADQEEDEEDDRDARILQVKHSRISRKPKEGKKSGFGMGVLNDTGSDDDDPYALGPQISYNRAIGAGKKRKKKPDQASDETDQSVVKPSLGTKKLAQHSTTSRASTQRCHDGRSPLLGFILSLESLSISDKNEEHAPPTIPNGWTSKKFGSAGTQTSSFQSTADAARASNLDEKSRAALLGEQQLPGKSVFDFMSTAARDRLVAASGNSNLPQARGEGAPAGFETTEADRRRTLWDLVPQLDKGTAEAALHRGSTGWMPYAEDEEKRRRYRYFLELSAGQQSHLPEKPKVFSVDEWSKELREFAQAAAVFRPVSGLMAARFTSSSSTPKLASDAPDAETLEQAEDPREKAARMGMYGPLTRVTYSFHPARLVCKRFNVPPPAVDQDDDPDGGDAGRMKRSDTVRSTALDRVMRDASLMPRALPEGSNQLELESTRAPVALTEPVNTERNEALESEKPGDAVFRAIFGSDSEDE